MCPTDGRRKLLVDHFWFLMGAGGWEYPGAQAPQTGGLGLALWVSSPLFPFFSPSTFLPSPSPHPLFFCWHEMPPGEPAGPNFQTLFIHSTSTRAGVPGSGLDVEEAKGCGENLCALVS